ncbi:MAG TPA: hypothetical protein VLX58_10450 [Bryobacteraceae bacterium]|nr:hypothetical protein [Bryobacteraceae bacterium]
MKILAIGITILGVFALTLPAADITGKWTASFTTQDGRQRENTWNFKVDGDKLTGTVTSDVLGEAPLNDGKVNGDEVSFSVLREIGGNTVKILYRGKVSGDEIKFKVEGGRRNLEITAKRVTS